MGHFFPTQRGNGFRLSVAGNEHSQQQAGKLPVDVVPRPRWSSGPRVPAHDMVEVDRVDWHIDRSRKESESCKNKTVTWSKTHKVQTHLAGFDESAALTRCVQENVSKLSTTTCCHLDLDLLTRVKQQHETNTKTVHASFLTEQQLVCELILLRKNTARSSKSVQSAFHRHRDISELRQTAVFPVLKTPRQTNANRTATCLMMFDGLNSLSTHCCAVKWITADSCEYYHANSTSLSSDSNELHLF